MTEDIRIAALDGCTGKNPATAPLRLSHRTFSTLSTASLSLAADFCQFARHYY